MIVGGEKILETAKTLLDNIEEDGLEDLIEIDDVFIIVEVRYADPDEHSSSGSLFYRCTSAQYHVQRGILVHAKEAVKNAIRRDDD